MFGFVQGLAAWHTGPPSMNKTTAFFKPPAALVARARIPSVAVYEAHCAAAKADYEGFWMDHARRLLDWHLPFTCGLNADSPPFFKWFEDGLLNASYNCLDRHVQSGQGDKLALIFEADDGQVTRLTYSALLARTCQLAQALRAEGVQPGDRVLIYMPMSIEGVVAMQACARIGAVHSVVFGGFSAQSLRERIEDAGAVLVLTADEQCRGGKRLPLKTLVDEALSLGRGASVRRVLVYRRTGAKVPMQVQRDRWLHEAVSVQPIECEPEWVQAEHPLFLLYTSGSTGRPKGVQHATAGYLLHAALTCLWTFDLKADDIFWCTADIGWITGHTYVAYGPLALGATQVIFEGVPTFPDAARFWRMIERHRVSIFYTAPTAIRALIKACDNDPSSHPRQFDLTSLRILGSVGEPINPAAWLWYHEQVGGGRCPVLDTFWQTETGGHVIAPMPGATPLVPGSCTLPFPGIMAAVVDEHGDELPWGQPGYLVIQRPWPSMVRGLYGDPERFKSCYFPEEFQRPGQSCYLAGDGAVRDSDTGYFTVTGRLDDVLNVSGHRLGTMEIESALVAQTELVAEAAVVGIPDPVTGEAVCAFVVLKRPLPEGPDAHQQTMALAQTLRDWVSHQIGPIAKPRDIRFASNLPKTRSGKIMRRLLRTVARGEPITQDTSTLENPAILDQLGQAF